MKFKDINTINEALKLVGYTVFVSSISQVQPEQKGITGFTVTDITGEYWGEIINIETGGSINILEIRDKDDEVIYVPFDDAIIKEIDEQERTVIIDPPKGLRELNK